MIKGDYAIAELKPDGSLGKYVRYASEDLCQILPRMLPRVHDISNMDFFVSNAEYISTPPPELIDPTGLTGIGYGTLLHPHTKYCVANARPDLGKYVYPFDELLDYVCIDGSPPFFSATSLHIVFGQLFDKLPPTCLRVPDTSDPPLICIVV